VSPQINGAQRFGSLDAVVHDQIQRPTPKARRRWIQSSSSKARMENGGDGAELLKPDRSRMAAGRRREWASRDRSGVLDGHAWGNFTGTFWAVRGLFSPSRPWAASQQPAYD
jgi:hypothetical protein